MRLLIPLRKIGELNELKRFGCSNSENKVLYITIVKLKFNHLHKIFLHSFAEMCKIVSRHIKYLYKNKGRMYDKVGEILGPSVNELDLISWQACCLIKIKHAQGYKCSWFELFVYIQQQTHLYSK